MALGEHPDKVDPRFLITLDQFQSSAHDIGRFRDIGMATGVNRFAQAGGAIMEDFDNDGLLDLVTTSWSVKSPMAFYRNNGDGTFTDRTEEAGLAQQLGGLYCVQVDYNNDGWMDIYVPGAPGFAPRFAPPCSAMTARAASSMSRRRPACSIP
jgi:hypothetical protein